jgi:hypothetical protein
MESLKNKILGGEKVKASAGMIKKIMMNLHKDKKDSQNRSED